MTAPPRVWAPAPASLDEIRPRLCEIVIACVAAGASIGFLEPLAPAEADAYWEGVGRAVEADRRILLVAGWAGEAIAGTVQLDVDTSPNQPHRATVSKLLVDPARRRRGVGEALMAGAEGAAVAAGRWLLTLDTATPAAARLYARMGWSPAGVIPGYAMNPDRSLTDTTFYWKRLGTAGETENSFQDALRREA